MLARFVQHQVQATTWSNEQLWYWYVCMNVSHGPPYMLIIIILLRTVEYTPQAFLQTDLDKFFTTYSPTQVGTSPVLAPIDGGTLPHL